MSGMQHIYISTCDITLQKCWDVKPGGKLKDMATPGSQYGRKDASATQDPERGAREQHYC